MVAEKAIATRPEVGESIERVLIGGDLSRLSAEERVSYYMKVCENLGLNPLTKPFEYLRLNGKEVLYARRDATEQLRKLHGVSIANLQREVVEGCYVVTARAVDAHGRTDESIGAVPIDGLKGENRANAMMKAETKAKRRVTLSICGLGMLDETEVESIPGARVAPVALPQTERPVLISAQPAEAATDPKGAFVSAMAALPSTPDDVAEVPTDEQAMELEIVSCSTLEELSALVPKLKAMPDGAGKARLRAVYNKKRGEVQS